MSIIKISSITDPRVAMFATLTEAQLRNRLDPSQGIFIAESPKVIHVALDAGYEPLCLLCEEKHIAGDAARIIERANALPAFVESADGFPVYTGSREQLATLTGYTLTRGVLCAMRRPMPRNVKELLAETENGSAAVAGSAQRRIVVIDGVVDTTNIGAIFRSAAALGIDAVLLTPNSCDPLNRRSIRVSMGSVFLVPWTWLDDYQVLHGLGYETAAMALTDDSVSISNPILKEIPRLAIIMGTEGEGLPAATIAAANHVVKIPMSHQVDSLNVAAAAALAFWELRSQR